MPGYETETQRLAREAAERIDRDIETGQQLSLLPEPALPEVGATGEKAVGRPKGAQNKGSSQLRDWLSSRGLMMPEEVIGEMAGLHRSQGMPSPSPWRSRSGCWRMWGRRR